MLTDTLYKKNELLTNPTAQKKYVITSTSFLPNLSVDNIVQMQAKTWIQPMMADEISGATLVPVALNIVCKLNITALYPVS